MLKRECRAVTRMFWDYAQGRLSESEADRVEIHIARCGKCRREFQTYRISAGLVKRYRQEPEPESKATWHALRTQLQHIQKEKPVDLPAPVKRSSAVPAWAGTVAAGAILAAVWTSFRSAEVRPESADLLMLKGKINTPVASMPPAINVGPSAQGSADAADDPGSASGATIQDAGFRPVSTQQASVTDSGAELSEPFLLRPEEQFEVKSAGSRRSPAKRQAKKESTRQNADAGAPESIVLEPRREFVMGTIPMGTRIQPVAGNNPDSTEEPPVW